MRIAARRIVAVAPICFKIIEQPSAAQIPPPENRAVAFCRPVRLIFGVATSCGTFFAADLECANTFP
jgi:hypothetical protein